MKEINYTEVHKKIINRIMLDGKKRKAEGIFDNSFFVKETFGLSEIKRSKLRNKKNFNEK